jgi:hypothetical protein
MEIYSLGNSPVPPLLMEKILQTISVPPKISPEYLHMLNLVSKDKEANKKIVKEFNQISLSLAFLRGAPEEPILPCTWCMISVESTLIHSGKSKN